jgi:hypothetical protein
VAALRDSLGKRDASLHDVEDGRAGIHPGENVHIRHAEVAIENQGATPKQAERRGQVHGHRCFPHAAFSRW